MLTKTEQRWQRVEERKEALREEGRREARGTVVDELLASANDDTQVVRILDALVASCHITLAQKNAALDRRIPL